MSTTINNQHVDEQITTTYEQSVEAGQQCVKDHPISAAALAIGGGVVVGLVCSVLLSSSEQQRRRSFVSEVAGQVNRSISQYLPDSMNFRR